MSSPTVSVVIPCFNQGRFLGEALASVEAQICPAAEIVLVDDGSTDTTSAVVKQFPRVRYIRQRNLGLARARNAGLRAAHGDYLVFLDADDRLRCDALAVGIAELAAHPSVALVFGRCQRIDEAGAPLPTRPTTPISGHCYAALLRRNPIWTPAIAMFRRAVCEPLMHFEPAVDASADYELYLRIARHYRIHGHTHVVADYRLHGASMSRNAALMLRSTMAVMRAQRQFLESGHHAAYCSGLRAWRWRYGELLVEQAGTYARDPRHWPDLMTSVAVLLRHYPGGIAAHARRKLRRWLRPQSTASAGAQRPARAERRSRFTGAG
jgi:glycosyltransferase involved in cell wall biosynthesis